MYFVLRYAIFVPVKKGESTHRVWIEVDYCKRQFMYSTLLDIRIIFMFHDGMHGQKSSVVECRIYFFLPTEPQFCRRLVCNTSSLHRPRVVRKFELSSQYAYLSCSPKNSGEGYFENRRLWLSKDFSEPFSYVICFQPCKSLTKNLISVYVKHIRILANTKNFDADRMARNRQSVFLRAHKSETEEAIDSSDGGNQLTRVVNPRYSTRLIHLLV